MSVPLRKSSRLFSCASEKFGFFRSLNVKVVGGGPGVAAGAKAAPARERRFCLPSSQGGFA